jgi:hypothetical protein
VGTVVIVATVVGGDIGDTDSASDGSVDSADSASGDDGFSGEGGGIVPDALMKRPMQRSKKRNIFGSAITLLQTVFS